MKSDCYAPPSYPYVPPQAPEAHRMSKFTRDCIGWGLLAGAGGVALVVVLIMLSSLLSP